MFKKILLAAVLMLAVGCTDEVDSERALHSYGFTNIQFTGYEFFGCSDSDHYHTGFYALNAQKQRVQGVVCCGVFKACTVRF